MKIKAKYKGAIIRDNKIGRALEVNEKNLPTFLAYGYDYLLEKEEPKKVKKKLLENDAKVTKKSNKRNSTDIEGTSNAGES